MQGYNRRVSGRQALMQKIERQRRNQDLISTALA
jgi:hypothetical protein